MVERGCWRGKLTHWGPAETLVEILRVHVRCQPATAVLTSIEMSHWHMVTLLPEKRTVENESLAKNVFRASRRWFSPTLAPSSFCYWPRIRSCLCHSRWGNRAGCNHRPRSASKTAEFVAKRGTGIVIQHGRVQRQNRLGGFDEVGLGSLMPTPFVIIRAESLNCRDQCCPATALRNRQALVRSAAVALPERVQLSPAPKVM